MLSICLTERDRRSGFMAACIVLCTQILDRNETAVVYCRTRRDAEQFLRRMHERVDPTEIARESRECLDMGGGGAVYTYPLVSRAMRGTMMSHTSWIFMLVGDYDALPYDVFHSRSETLVALHDERLRVRIIGSNLPDRLADFGPIFTTEAPFDSLTLRLAAMDLRDS